MLSVQLRHMQIGLLFLDHPDFLRIGKTAFSRSATPSRVSRLHVRLRELPKAGQCQNIVYRIRITLGTAIVKASTLVSIQDNRSRRRTVRRGSAMRRPATAASPKTARALHPVRAWQPVHGSKKAGGMRTRLPETGRFTAKPVPKLRHPDSLPEPCNARMLMPQSRQSQAVNQTFLETPDSRG